MTEIVLFVVWWLVVGLVLGRNVGWLLARRNKP